MDPRDPRAGFTLVELLIVVLMVGILSGLALPNIRGALYRARAASIIQDIRVIENAARAYITENGTFPPAGAPGSAPEDLEAYLPEGFEFTADGGVLYSFLSITLPNADNPWQTANLGLVLVFYPGENLLATALQGHQGQYALWTPTLMLFLIAD